MSVVYDVAVIGGGATGCGVARDLAMRNLSVVLIERGKLCEGTTGHSHCLLHSGARYADSDPAGASECAAENEILKEIGGCCVEETGGYFVQLEGDSAEYFEEKLEKCQELGIETKVLDGDDVREREPQVSSRVEKAIKVPDGVIYPSRLVAANALSAEEHGADIVTGRGVVDIDSTENWNIKLGDGEIRASHVVNATGAWAGEVGAMAGVNIDMNPTKGVMVVVRNEKVESVINRCRPPDDGDIAVPYRDNIILGTTSVEVESADSYSKTDEEIEVVVEECAAMLPSVSHDDVERVYWGVRPLYGGSDESGRRISRDFHLLDHSERDGVKNFTTIVGGKLTTYRRMAEEVSDHICDKLGVEAECRTRDELPADDSELLDSYINEVVYDCSADTL